MPYWVSRDSEVGAHTRGPVGCTLRISQGFHKLGAPFWQSLFQGSQYVGVDIRAPVFKLFCRTLDNFQALLFSMNRESFWGVSRY